MATTYGVLSDFHTIDFRVLIPSINKLKSEEVDALVLNGDIFGERSEIHPEEYLANLLEISGRSNLETYVIPGNYEDISLFEPIIQHFSKKYGNIINTFKESKIEKKDHYLVFLQGGDFSQPSLGHYNLSNQRMTGFYDLDGEIFYNKNMSDLKSQVNIPEKTIVFSHIPMLFDSDKSVDFAKFWLVEESFIYNNRIIETNAIFPGPIGYEFKKKGAPISYHTKNRGNLELKTLFQELGINKSITGHFHESVGHANDVKGNSVEECLFVDELFYNASYMDTLKLGLVTIDDSKIAYENIKLK